MTGCSFMPASPRTATVRARLARAIVAGIVTAFTALASHTTAALATAIALDGVSRPPALHAFDRSDAIGRLSAVAGALAEPLILLLVSVAAVVLVARQVRRLRRPRLRSH